MAKHALCVGINDYPGTGMDLRGCVNDALDWQAALEARGFQVRLLLDDQATRQGMVAAIEALIGAARPGDSLAITFSGHGSYQLDEDGDEARGFDQALCPWDVQSAGALVDDELRRMFGQRADGVRLVLIADSCHSGSVNRAPTRPDPMPRFLPPQCWWPQERLAKAQALHAQGGRTASLLEGMERPGASDVLLAGCGDGEHDFSYDARFAGRSNGAFSWYALQTLAQLPPDASYAHWHAQIRKHLPSVNYPQQPQLGGDEEALRLQVLS